MLYDPKWEQKVKISQILIEARKKIARPEDWACGDAVQIGGKVPMCAGVAIHYSAPDKETQHAALTHFSQTIGSQCIPIWNDAPNRTHAEVLNAFDRAIATAR